MSEPTYQHWVDTGRVWHPAQPIAQLAAALWPLHGEVGTIGDTRHLEARTPEDHCPFSHTGWPVANMYPYVCAIDYSGPKWVEIRNWWIYNAHIGFAPWSKYINTGHGMEYRHDDRFTHGVPNSDANHVHLSIRSDWTHKSIGNFDVVPPTLREGARGNAVKVAQLRVHVKDDGIFGPVTLAAVRNAQRQNGLTVDGIVGYHTWYAILPKY